MKTRTVIGILVVTLSQVFAYGESGQKVTTRLRVVDVEGKPLIGMDVGISYPDVTGNKYDSIDGITDAEGVFSYRGSANKEVYYSVRKEGYYLTRGKALVYDRDKDGIVYFDPLEIQVVAKEIRNPIVMLATKRFHQVVPAGTRVGFDFFENDLTHPYGRGDRSDVYFYISGEYEDRHNHDSLLSIDFAGEGDGLIPFEMDFSQGSVLESDHEAPAEGYVRFKRMRKSIREHPVKLGYAEYERVDEVREGIGYYFRIRTELDVDGNVLSAYYGKIYGDFNFFGAHPDGSYVRAEAYYLNPTAIDRNVEAVSGESLLPDLSRLELPNRP